MMKKCLCGKPLHYQSRESQKLVEKLVAELGEDIEVVSLKSHQVYLFPRHYIALHGLKGNEIDKIAKKYGLKEVKRVIRYDKGIHQEKVGKSKFDY